MKVRKVVIPIGGIGERLQPATFIVGKENLPIGTKPLIHFAAQEAVDSGIHEILFVTRPGQQINYLNPMKTGRKSTDLHDHKLRPISEITKEVEILSHDLTTGPGGFGGAILRAKKFVGGDPFAVMLIDAFIDARRPCLAQIIDAFTVLDAPVFAVTRIRRREIPEFGVIQGERHGRHLYRVRRAIEKPPANSVQGNPLGIVGRYVLTPRVFEFLEEVARKTKSGAIELTSALNAEAQIEPVYASRFEGEFFHVGTELGYLKTIIYYALRRSTLAPIVRRESCTLLSGPRVAQNDEIFTKKLRASRKSRDVSSS